MHSHGRNTLNGEVVAYEWCLMNLEEGTAHTGLFLWDKPSRELPDILNCFFIPHVLQEVNDCWEMNEERARGRAGKRV